MALARVGGQHRSLRAFGERRLLPALSHRVPGQQLADPIDRVLRNAREDTEYHYAARAGSVLNQFPKMLVCP